MGKVIYTVTATSVSVAPWVETSTWQVGFYGTKEEKDDEE